MTNEEAYWAGLGPEDLCEFCGRDRPCNCRASVESAQAAADYWAEVERACGGKP